MPMAVADFAAEWFETEILRAVVCARGIFGAFAGPWSAGTTANLLLQAAAHGGNGAGSATLVAGGLGALADGARGRGARLRRGDPHRRRGRAHRHARRPRDRRRARGRRGDRGGRGRLGRRPAPHVPAPARPRGARPRGPAAHPRLPAAGHGSKVNLALSALPSFTAVGAEDAGDAPGRPHPHRPRGGRPRARVRRRQVRRHRVAALPRRHHPDADRPVAGARRPARAVRVRAVHAVPPARGRLAGAARRGRRRHGPPAGGVRARDLEARPAPPGADARSTSSSATASPAATRSTASRRSTSSS